MPVKLGKYSSPGTTPAEILLLIQVKEDLHFQQLKVKFLQKRIYFLNFAWALTYCFLEEFHFQPLNVKIFLDLYVNYWTNLNVGLLLIDGVLENFGPSISN